jgi:hypothetical protein
MPEDNGRSGGVDTGAGNVEVGGDVVGRDNTKVYVKVDPGSKEPTSPSVMGVIGVIGLIIVALALVLIFGPRAQNSGQTPSPSPEQGTVSNTPPDIPPVSLVGLNYTVDSDDTRSLDLRTASSEGILKLPDDRLRFTDLRVFVPSNAPDYQVRADFYVGNDDQTLIGSSETRVVKQGNNSLGNVTLTKGFQYGDSVDTWRVRKDWENITIKLITIHGKDEVESNWYYVKLNSQDDLSWFYAPPNVTFASVIYAIDDGPDQVLDFRADANDANYTQAISATHPFTLTLREVWYKSNAQRNDQKMTLHAYLTDSDYNDETKHWTDTMDIQGGIRKASSFAHAQPGSSPSSWVIPADFATKNYRLVMYWIRDDGASTDGLSVPIRFSSAVELAIESIASWVHAYLTDDASPASFSNLVGVYRESSGTTYKHQYSFPDQAKGFAGLIFEFAHPEDLSTYDAVQYTLAVGGSPAPCFLGMRDSSRNHQEIPCQGPFTPDSGITVKAEEDKQTITIPLQKNYTKVALNAIDQVYTDMDPSATKGTSEVKISNIKFIKQ